MTLPRRRLLQLTAAGLALPALPRIARAQAYPSRPITMIVPYTAGGPTDTARPLPLLPARNAASDPDLLPPPPVES